MIGIYVLTGLLRVVELRTNEGFALLFQLLRRNHSGGWTWFITQGHLQLRPRINNCRFHSPRLQATASIVLAHYSTHLLLQTPTIPNFRVRVRFRVSRVRFRVRVSGPSKQQTFRIADLQNGGPQSHQSPFTHRRQHVTLRQQPKTLFLCNHVSSTSYSRLDLGK